ncbi:carboxymuconolactone decarboxylase family protein [Actinomadura fibrosa]|uniref:Carboxymuconolactone decarboxylase family protein n=1 Tax=Actinomadura fibrosa TaxID=111802 RepID=A0ABW2XN01_9ACTN|nr:carboxymuconolactone decarboxylase family protein [Actinomadura fibrosa]
MTTVEEALKGIESRLPNPAKLVPELGQVSGALAAVAGNGSVPRTTIGLVQLRVGQIFGSTYLVLLHSGNLREAGEAEERIAAVASWQDSPHFTDSERVALALAEAVFTPNPGGQRVPDALYTEASIHYDDKALATLIMAIGQVAFYVPLAVIGQPVPGVPFPVQWR